MALLTVSFQMLALLIIIGTGYLIAKKGMMDAHTNGQVSGMIVNVFNPLLFFSSAANSVGQISLFSAVKLLVLPLLMYPVLKLVTKDPAVISVCMIMFSMPAGNMNMILGTERGIDGRTCSAAIILSTVLCVLTVPVLVTPTL